MAVMLVLYEIHDDERKTKVVSALKRRHRMSIRLTETAYAMHTPMLPVRVYDELKEHLRAGDQLYVIPISSPYTGYGPRKTTVWLSDYLS